MTDRNAEVIARRRTFDDKSILLWSDGDITFGHVGSLVSRRVPLAAAWLALDEVCLYDSHEVKRLVYMARRAVKQRSVFPLEYLRNKMAGRRLQNVNGDWAVHEWK